MEEDEREVKSSYAEVGPSWYEEQTCSSTAEEVEVEDSPVSNYCSAAFERVWRSHLLASVNA